MSTYKTTSSDYTVSIGPYDTGNSAWLGTMTVNGNLNVVGNITYVTDIKVNDAFIVVAANNTGTVNDMGLVAQKSGSSWAGLRFDTTANCWQVSSSTDINGSPVAAYANIATGNASVAGANTQIQFNDGGSFGASANLTFNFSSGVLALQGYETFGNIGTTPSYTGNGVAIYNNTQGTGGTGLYVKNTTVNDELISLTKARLLAIIF